MRISAISAICGCVFSITAAGFSGPLNNDVPGGASRPASISYESKKLLFEQRMDDYITQQMTDNGGIGISIVVADGNRVIYKKGFGLADVENSTPVDSSTLFHIGSVTKLFTGISIMQLAQRGLIDIDAPIQQYLPDFSIKYHFTTRQPITIRSIMAHQSGIFGDKQANFMGAEYPTDDFRTFPQFAQNEYAPYHPNYITAYSNFAISLLGLIVERVSGVRYEDYVYNNILRPCNMLESGFDPKKDHPSLLAKGYDAEGNPYPYFYISANPAGFLASSGNDMGNFIKMILNNGSLGKNRILPPRTLNSMYQPQGTYLPMNMPDPYQFNFGLSWLLGNRSFDYLGSVVGHDGYLPPYQTMLMIAKDQNIGVFVSSNKDYFSPNTIAYTALAQAAQIFRGISRPELPPLPPVTSLPRHLQRMYTGTYTVVYDYPIEVFAENDTMFMQFLHTPRIPLVYHADDWFSLVVDGAIVPDVRFAFKFIGGRKVLCVESRDEFLIDRQIYGNTFVPVELTDDVRSLTGTWLETQSNTPALVLYTDVLSRTGKEFLTAIDLANGAPYIVNPAENNTFITQGLGRGAQETVYLTNDTLNYSGYKFVKYVESTPTLARFATRAIEPTTTRERTPAQVVDALKKQIKKENLLR